MDDLTPPHWDGTGPGSWVPADQLIEARRRLAEVEAEAEARGRMEGAKAMQEAAAEEVEGYPSMDGADIPIVRGCAFAVRALDPAAIVKGLNDAD